MAKNVYIVTKISILSDGWEPVDEGCLQLVGVYDTKDKAKQAIKDLDLIETEIKIHKVKLNHTPNDEEIFTELYSWLNYIDDLYDDPMDI